MTADNPAFAECFCLASGPSLNKSDVEAVRAWRDASPGRGVIVTNTTFRLAPWADCLWAQDKKWWRVHHQEVQAVFAGRCLSPKAAFCARGIDVISRNSGAGAINLAIRLGASLVYLLGYDCQYTGGKRHWHGDHPKGLGNAHSMPMWMPHFVDIARRRRATIINCTRETALRCFPRQSLEEVLNACNAG